MTDGGDVHPLPGVEDLRRQLEEAPEAGALPGGGERPPGKGRPRGEIWDGCPVKALGVNGKKCCYLDQLGQLREIDNHTVQEMLSLFGGNAVMLGRHFPSYNKEGVRQVGKFVQIDAAAAMITACNERGLWSPDRQMRGPGFWTDEDGRLVYHAGDALLVGDAWRPPGVYQGKTYAASPPIPRPADRDRQFGAAEELLELAQTWNWRRPDIDPQLVVGMVAAQMIGGALEWRPVGWLTGDAATGKSTFQRMLLHLHGGEAGLLQAADATEAGIRSAIGHSSLPVAIDELEPDPDRPQKARGVVELARRAASGSAIFRGGADQRGHQSNAYSAFLFSSILVPDMPAQDRARLILLDLDRLSVEAPKVNLDPRRLRGIGAALRRLLIDRWDQWPQRLEMWRGALARHGQVGRAGDNYGTVLALADLVQAERPPDAETLEDWAARLASHVSDDAAEIGSNAEDMLVHLMSQPLDVWRRGRRFTVAQWVAMAARLPGAPEAIDTAGPTDANTYLAPYGLRVYGRAERAALAIANKPLQGLVELFEGSMWAGGVWKQAAQRVAGAERLNITLAGVATRAVRVPLQSIPGMLAFPMDRDRGDEAGPAPHDGREVR